MDTKPAYDVTVDEAGLNWEKAGPLFDRYAVGLTGNIDRRWVETYQRITVSAPTFTRFRLEACVSSVTFTCRSSDGPVEVMKVLKRLEELLLRVNREATAGAAAGPPETDVAARPTQATAGRQTQVESRPSQALGGLLSRFTKH